MTVKRILPVLWSVSFYAILIGCSSDANNIKEANPDELRKEISPTEVETVRAVKKPFDYQIHSNGVVVASEEAEIIFRTGGVIEKLLVQEGKHVKKGQLLAVIDNNEQALALEKAKISLKERQLEFESQLLASGGRGDSAQMATVRDNIAYVSGLRAAELEYRQAEMLYNNTFIKAPITGQLSDVQVNKGATVANGDKLCAIFSVNNLLVQTEILESVVGRVEIGQQAVIQPLALDHVFDAAVQTINPRVDKNGTVRLGLKVSNSTGLLPGMHVAVTISAPYNKNIIVPESALVIRSGKEVVFVEEEGLAKWHYVTTGLKSNNEVEVLTGLEEGNKVIITNNIYLAHDTPVKEYKDKN